MASITITSNISDMDGGSGAAYAVCFQDSEFTDVANVKSEERAAVIRYVMDHKNFGDGSVVVPMTAGSPPLFSARLEKELANVDTPPGYAIPIDFGVTNHHAYVVTQSGKFENAFHVKHVPVTIEQQAVEGTVVQGTFPSKWTNDGWTSKTVNVDGGDKLFWINTFDDITYEIYGSEYRVAGEEPYRAFSRYFDDTGDRDTNYELNINGNDAVHGWHGSPADWISITAIVKLSKAINISSYYFRARNISGTTNQRPSKWNMYVSHDGNTWTEIDSRDNEGANYTLNSAQKFDAPTYIGYYEWIKIVFDNQNNYWFSQTDWRFDGTYMDYAAPPAAADNWELLHRDVHTQTMTIGNYNNTVEGEADFANIYSQMGDWSTKILNQEDYFSDGKYLFRIIPYATGDTRLSPDNTERFIEFEQSNDITSSGAVTDFAIIGSNYQGAPSTALYTSTNYYATTYTFSGLRANGGAYTYISGTSDINWGGIIHGPETIVDGLTFIIDSGAPGYATPNKLELYIWRGPKP